MKNHIFLQHRRSKRSTHSVKPSEKHNQSSSSSSLVNHLIYPITDRTGPTCRLHTLYITFQQLRWDDWIFAPPGYGAFYCAGSCDFPFPHHVEATNHAVIQHLAHLLQSHKIPKPCCAPSKLQTISLLYELNGATYLKRYRGMIAKECACQ